MKVEDLRIGMKVAEVYHYPFGESRRSFAMTVTGILSDGTVYLDFEGNEGDAFEVDAKD